MYTDQQIIDLIHAVSVRRFGREGCGVEPREIARTLAEASNEPETRDRIEQRVARKMRAMAIDGTITSGCYRGRRFYRAVSAASIQQYSETGEYPQLVYTV